METVDNRTFKEKVHDGWTKLKWKVEDGVKWIKDNPAPAATIATATAVTVKTTYKIVKTVIAASEDKERRKEVYCNDIQSTVKLKHELNYNEQRELRDRMNIGQSKFEALDEMHLLKQ